MGTPHGRYADALDVCRDLAQYVTQAHPGHVSTHLRNLADRADVIACARESHHPDTLWLLSWTEPYEGSSPDSLHRTPDAAMAAVIAHVAVTSGQAQADGIDFELDDGLISCDMLPMSCHHSGAMIVPMRVEP